MLQSWRLSFSNSCLTMERRASSPVRRYGGRAGTPGSPPASLTPVIRYWLGMNQHPEQLRRVVFEADLERCLNVVPSGKRHIVGQRAVTGNIEPPAHFLELKFVHIHHVGKLLHNILEP